MTIPWDWKDFKRYEHLGPDTPGVEWVWEFVRRGSKYQDTWESVTRSRDDLIQTLLKNELAVEEYKSKELDLCVTNLIERARKCVL
jgi:hypothetical protein